jgi:hypothetical protein
MDHQIFEQILLSRLKSRLMNPTLAPSMSKVKIETYYINYLSGGKYD